MDGQSISSISDEILEIMEKKKLSIGDAEGVLNFALLKIRVRKKNFLPLQPLKSLNDPKLFPQPQ